MALGAGGLAVAAAAYILIRPPTASARSIAVLPFTNVGGDSTNEPYSDGVADELTTALGKVNGLAVTARGSAFSFKEKHLNAREIGRRLEVRYIVEGSVKSAGGRRRIGAQLVDVASGKELWSDNFEHDVRNRDVFTVNDSIARSIVRQLLPRLSPAALATPAKRPTENTEAHELYLQGRFFFDKRSEAALKKAEVYFERAIALDSSYALAWSGLSDAYSHSSVFGYAKPADSFPKAKTYAIRALALDGTLAEAHASRAFVALFYEWDWETAGREFDLALAANPRSPSAHLWHAWYYLPLGKTDRVIGEVQTAVDLDRFSAVANTRLVTALFFGHRYDAALAQALKTIDLNPEFVGVRLELARVYTYLGRCAEALPLLGEAQPSAQLSGVVGWVYARCGRRQQAVVELDRLVADAARGRYESHYGRAVIQAGLGNTDQVIAELEQAYVERAWAMFDLRIEPAFDNVRAEPRFVDLVRRMRFPS